MHPPWAEELRQRYLRGEASQFILHGNVFDVVAWEGKLISLGDLSGRSTCWVKPRTSWLLQSGQRRNPGPPQGDLGGFEDLLVQRQPSKSAGHGAYSQDCAPRSH